MITAMTYALGQGTGPLRGIKVVEIAGIGPSPHACMILADLGADVIRVERPGGQLLTGGPHDLLNRGRPSVALNLKDPAAIATVLDLVADADVLIEGMRPGTTERLGLGPEECLARNPRLVYGRMTGWGQTGPLAKAAGHDMNYIAITGALFAMGQDKAKPHFPANLVGDFGGGSTYLVIGVLAALLEARVSGEGQVVDAAIVDGTAHLNAMAAGMHAGGNLREERAANLLDGGVPFYDLYETSDGRHMSVGPLEPQFYDVFVELLGLEGAPDRYDFARGPELRRLIAEAFASRTQAEWSEVFEGTDACVAPILPLTEAMDHPHMAAREVFVDHAGVRQPAPAPRFSRTTATLSAPPAVRAGVDTREALAAWGIGDVDGLVERGVAVQA
jgi:alpha-methylacyl-CoA racemase